MSDLNALNNALLTSQALAQTTQAQTKQALQRPVDDGGDDQMTEAAHEYESVFIAEMLRHSFDTVPTDGPFHGGQGENIARSMLIDQYAKNIVQSGGIGLSDHIKATMIQMQAGH